MVENKLSKYLFLLINIAVSCVILLPLYYAVIVSLMSPSTIFSYPPPMITKEFYIQNYKDVIRLAPIFRFILNSLLVAGACTFGQLFTGALAGYAFAVLKFRGKHVIFILMLATMMIPGNAIIIANYLTATSLGILDTYAALVLPYLTTAFCVFNLRQAFLQLPGELNDAAKIDGCSNFQFFIRIGIPLVKPSLGALGIYTFLQVWNQYLWPLLVTNNVNMRTVQIGIGMLQNADANAFGPIMAGIVMVLTPSLLAFVVGQKQLIAGLTAGSVKG